MPEETHFMDKKDRILKKGWLFFITRDLKTHCFILDIIYNILWAVYIELEKKTDLLK